MTRMQATRIFTDFFIRINQRYEVSALSAFKKISYE